MRLADFDHILDRALMDNSDNMTEPRGVCGALLATWCGGTSAPHPNFLYTHCDQEEGHNGPHMGEFGNEGVKFTSAEFPPPHPSQQEPLTSDEVVDFPALPTIREMEALYVERRGTYGPSEVVFGKVMAELFPHGLTLRTADDWTRYGLLHHIVGKLTRYVSDFENPHEDSTIDIGNYAAMLHTEDKRVNRAKTLNKKEATA